MFNAIFYQPLLNGLVLLVNYLPFHDIGTAVIVLTLVARFIIFPFTHQTTTMQVKMKKIEPDLKKIKEDYKNDKQEQARKTMELYKKHRINPMWGFVSLFIQLPIIFAIYRVFLKGVNFDPSQLYYFVSLPATVGVNFLGIFDMTKPSYFLAILAALTQYYQMHVSIPPEPKTEVKKDASFKADFAKSMNMQMKYGMPFMIFLISFKLAAAIPLYWTVTNVFGILHAISVKKKAEKMENYGTANSNN